LLSKAAAFSALTYFLLFNVRVRNWLAKFMDRFKHERHGATRGGGNAVAAATEVARRQSRAERRWQKVEDALRCYKANVSPASWHPFQWREGRYVVLLMLIHVGMTLLATHGPVTGWPAAAVSGFLLFDTLAANTAIAFGRVPGINRLRSVILTMGAYLNVALAFAPVWVLHDADTTTGRAQRVVAAIYKAVSTLATNGPEGTGLLWWGKLTATLELLVGIYFLAIVIAIYASWAGSTARELPPEDQRRTQGEA
jgi:hypothetical protein